MSSSETARAKELLAYLVSKPDATIADYRMIYDEVCANFVLPEDARTEEVDIGGIRSLWVSAPGVSSTTVAIVVHGGGFTMGSAHGYREFGYRISQSGNCQSLVVDYRLAPENPFPAPVDDVVAAYHFARALPGIEKVVLVGDSAGGGIVVSTAITLRDLGAQLPDAIVVISPLVDLAGTGESLIDRAHLDPLPAAALVENMGGAYLGGLDTRHPVASPFHGDVSGFPPVFVLVGTDEGLHDDSVGLVDKLRNEGTPVEFEIGQGMPHIWPIFSFLPEARASTDRIGAYIRNHTLVTPEQKEMT
ncbi:MULTISPECIES: alpha/beta hydrolase [Rhodococcus]|uniref:alpha/beta hydrolase n=1 Tax=Rhodococcus TaxID=1827 RepID=UPI000978D16C|nr:MULTISPECIES: alpha/beta hydrolase [Rhodococcus]OMQ24347.1 hypothetical protein BK799_31470 [Rhodococcus sp. D-1]